MLTLPSLSSYKTSPILQIISSILYQFLLASTNLDFRALAVTDNIQRHAFFRQQARQH